VYTPRSSLLLSVVPFPNYTNFILKKPMIDRLPLVEELRLCFIGTVTLSLDLAIGEVFNLSEMNDRFLQDSQNKYGEPVLAAKLPTAC
jgi:hypothetical protein